MQPNRQPSPAGDQVALVLQAIRRGNGGSSKDLLPVVHEELRLLAMSRMAQEAAGQTLQATALVHEAWLRLVNDGDRTWQNRAHFFGAAAEAMRRILIENARRKARRKRGGNFVRVDLADVELADTTPDEKILLINEALEQMEKSDPEKAQGVVLKSFGGLTDRTVERHWAFAKAWLFEAIRNPVEN